MKKVSKKLIIVIIIASIVIVPLAAFYLLKTDDNIINKTYCSDVCPAESELVPYQVYKNDITAEDCINRGDTPNYAYGWSSKYLGCTPEGYKSLSEATAEMWSNQND